MWINWVTVEVVQNPKYGGLVRVEKSYFQASLRNNHSRFEFIDQLERAGQDPRLSPMNSKFSLSLLSVAALSLPLVEGASILQVLEFNLGADTPAIISTNFSEDALLYSDRTHEHNGSAFDAGGTLSTPSGSNIQPVPAYMMGRDYVRFANNARDNAGYVATVIADRPTNWMLMVDNRLNGPAGNTSSSNTTDPVLGGTLQWIIDGGWVRMHTGISPNGQGDFTSVDESGDGVGAGMGLNQHFAIYTLPNPTNVAVVFSNGIGGSNMIALAVPEPSSAMLLALGGLAFLRRRR